MASCDDRGVARVSRRRIARGEGGVYVVAGRNCKVSGEVDTLYDLNDLSPIRLGLESGEDSGEDAV